MECFFCILLTRSNKKLTLSSNLKAKESLKSSQLNELLNENINRKQSKEKQSGLTNKKDSKSNRIVTTILAENFIIALRKTYHG